MPRPLKKKIHITDHGETNGEWSYQIGRNGVRIRTPDMKTTVYKGFHDLLNGEFDGDEQVSIKPSDIKEYLKATDGLNHKPIWLD